MPDFLCKRCHKQALMVCNRCFDPYCCLQCQQLDWPMHKSMCFKMPSLIPLPKVFMELLDVSKDSHEQPNKAEQLVRSDETIPKQKENIFSEPEIITPAWKKCFPYVTEKFIDVVMLSIEDSLMDNVILWVSEAKYNDSYFKFLDELTNNNRYTKCSDDMIKIGQVVAINLKGLYHRSEIIGIDMDSPNIQIRIIDVGKKYYVPKNQLYVAVPAMIKTPSFAFMVCLPKASGPYKMEDPIKIYVSNEIFRNGIPFAKIQPKLELIKEREEMRSSTPIAEKNMMNEQIDGEEEEYPIARIKGVTSKEEQQKVPLLVSPIEIKNFERKRCENNMPWDTSSKPINNDQCKDFIMNKDINQNGEKKSNINDRLTKWINNSKFTLKDLKVIEISIGKNIPILILDASTIEKGFVTAADFQNTDFLKKLEIDLASVHKYGSQAHSKNKYRPKNDELCLAIFDEDESWYRAVCVEEIDNDTFLVMFVDYGNVTKVKAENILPITEKLMFPTNANLCTVKNLNKEQYNSFEGATLVRPIFVCDVETLETDDNPYTITLVESELKRLDEIR